MRVASADGCSVLLPSAVRRVPGSELGLSNANTLRMVPIDTSSHQPLRTAAELARMPQLCISTWRLEDMLLKPAAEGTHRGHH